MIAKIIGLIIGLLVVCVGAYYLVKEGKEDKESRNIYSIITALGVLVAAICIIFLIV